MKKNLKARLKLLVLFSFFINLSFCQISDPLKILDFEKKFSARGLILKDAKTALITEGNNHSLKVCLGHRDNRPSVKIPINPMDLSGYKGIAIDIKNLSQQGVAVEGQCFGENSNAGNNSIVWIDAGETDTLYITFHRLKDSLPAFISASLKGMNGLPGGYISQPWQAIDLTKVSGIEVFITKPASDFIFSMDNIRAAGLYKLPSQAELNNFFPFVDEFGQYIHGEWPGKTKSVQDILEQRKNELQDLEANPGPEEWDQYGGWESGPQLKVTGQFRVEKYNGKWWLVDPEGRLFWSHGIDCVVSSQSTNVNGRETYFTKIPPRGDFYLSNLLLKYSDSWTAAPRDEVTNMVHKRLRSWGINTIANWSDAYIYGQKKTPYTATLSSGIPRNLPSTLDEESFRATCASRLSRALRNTVEDPWCIGYFVDNELHWPESNAEEVIEIYFRVVKEELKKIAPDKLYLGSRIHNRNVTALKAAGRHCDVISINQYDYTVASFTLPDGVDKPVIIGEFHFGALDRGLPHPGLRPVMNQRHRALVYTNYVNQAIENPYFVGTHWFQYVDQVCTGRSDGENYQIGFIDICDRPYPEIISASRKTGTSLYTFRSKAPLTVVQ